MKIDESSKWADKWLDSVATGTLTMSQRKLSSIKRLGGDIEGIKTLAREKGVHLLLLRDDQGNDMIAASLHPFEVLC